MSGNRILLALSFQLPIPKLEAVISREHLHKQICQLEMLILLLKAALPKEVSQFTASIKAQDGKLGITINKTPRLTVMSLAVDTYPLITNAK